jgi:hypothetical protein
MKDILEKSPGQEPRDDGDAGHDVEAGESIEPKHQKRQSPGHVTEQPDPVISRAGDHSIGIVKLRQKLDQLSFRQLDNTVWCDVTRREVSYFFGKPPIFCSFASSAERSCAGACASLARSFCRFSFR